MTERQVKDENIFQICKLILKVRKMREEKITVTTKEIQELRKGFLMLKGLFETSEVYANRLTPTDMSNQPILVNNLVVGQTKAHKLFEKAKMLEAANTVECLAA